MYERSPNEPSLYRLGADGRSLDFEFAHCGDCQGLSFPANAPGCQHCGATLERAERVTRTGGGTLLEFVTLHVALEPSMAVPSIVGDICIADGVVKQGILGVDDEVQLRNGMAVYAVAVPLPGGEYYCCRFVTAEELSA